MRKLLLAGVILAQTALAELPVAISDAQHALIAPVIQSYTLKREYPARTFRGARAPFEFLMDDMAACSVLAEAMGMIQYRAQDVGDGRVVADDRSGARGFLQQVYCAEGERVYYVEGTQGGLFQARGRGVVVVRFTQTAPDTIEYTGKLFVKVDNAVLAALAQIFFAFVKSSVDRHFDHIMNQPVALSALAVQEPETLRRCIEAMPAEDARMLAPFLESLR